MSFVRTYGKSLFAVAAGVVTTGIGLWTGDHHIDPSEGVAIAIAGVNLAAVYIIPLVPGARWTKTAASFLLTFLQVLAVVIIGGIDANDVYLLITAVAGFLGVAIAPATSTTESHPVSAKVGFGD
jgi:uncharacterized protein involved in response to NO